MGEIYPVPERILKKKGALLFSEIEEGFSRYEHVILERTEPEYRHMLDEMCIRDSPIGLRKYQSKLL